MTVYGPYSRADGRKHVIHYDGVTRRTQSYPRYLMEKHLGRELLPEEHVDHIDGDLSNNSIDNLQILSVKDNNKKATRESGRSSKWMEATCAYCGELFDLQVSVYRHNQIKLGKAGPYCSRSCVGKVHH